MLMAKIFGIKVGMFFASFLPAGARQKCFAGLMRAVSKQYESHFCQLMGDMADGARVLAAMMVLAAKSCNRRNMAQTGSLESLVWAEGFFAERPDLESMRQRDFIVGEIGEQEAHALCDALHKDIMNFTLRKQRSANNLRYIHAFLREVVSEETLVDAIELEVEEMIRRAGMGGRVTVR